MRTTCTRCGSISTRLSGDVDSWQRLNRRFLNVLRKQFLVWRTVDQEVKKVYNDEGRELLGTPVRPG